MSYNKIILMGRLTADPELRRTPAGMAVTSFTLAVDRPRGKTGVQEADFISCVAWDKTAEFVAKYFAKGQPILVEGALQTRVWEDRQGNRRKAVEVAVREVHFAGSKGADKRPAPVSADDFSDLDDDGTLPF